MGDNGGTAPAVPVAPRYLVKAARVYDVKGKDLGHDGRGAAEDDRGNRLHNASAYLVKAGVVYDQDGKKLGLLNWQTDHDLMHALLIHRDRVQILGPHVRLGQTVARELNDSMVVVEHPMIGPDGTMVKDTQGYPVYTTHTEMINVTHFTVRAGLVWDGDGHYLGSYQERKDLIAKSSAAKVTWIGPRPDGAPAEAPQPSTGKHAVPRGGPHDYLLASAVDDIADHGWNLGNASKAALGVITGVYEYAFHVGYGDEERSPFGAFYDSVLGVRRLPNGITAYKVNGLDVKIAKHNFRHPEHVQWAEQHYNAVKDTTAGALKAVTVALAMPVIGKSRADLLGAGVGSGFTQLGESLADYDAGLKEKWDVVVDVASSVVKAEVLEIVDQLVKKLPLSSAVKRQIAGKVAKGVTKITWEQIETWTTPAKPGETPQQEMERKKRMSLAVALAGVEAMAIDLVAEGLPQRDAVRYFRGYGKDLMKGFAVGFTKDHAAGVVKGLAGGLTKDHAKDIAKPILGNKRSAKTSKTR